MRRILLLFLLFFTVGQKCFSLEIVYPKKSPVTINAKSTFFIGSTAPEEILKINGQEVTTDKNGLFAQIVPLTVGKNEFTITSESKDKTQTTINYVIETPQLVTKTYTPPVLIEYPPMNHFEIKTESTPLRSTPINAGINRLAHLFKGTSVTINGEKGEFYRVYLNSKTTGWIDKSNVESTEKPSDKKCDAPIKIKRAKAKLSHEFYTYEFELEQKVPFSVREESSPLKVLKVSLFNIEGQEDNTLEINIPVEKFVGYETFFQENTFFIKIRRAPIIDCNTPLKNIKITVDPGHGGEEAGAIGCAGAKEKDINLAISKNLSQELEKRGAKVFITRKEDTAVSLNERIKLSKEENSTILISIHANALPDGADPMKNKGTSVYYYHPQAKLLAENILTSMTTELGTNNDKVRQGSLALVRPTSSVSVLVEVGYMINPEDYINLTDKEFQTRCAKAIADGIENYLKN